jgi:predicted alpha/beta hydrolase family esterase
VNRSVLEPAGSAPGHSQAGPRSPGGQRAPRPPRLLIVPGLQDSGPAHWQSWLQAHYRHSLRVVQRDWTDPDLERWAARIGATLDRAGPGPWIAAAHSFGCLALARHLADRPDSLLRAVLLVAPAEPDKFGLAEALPQRALPVPALLVGSQTDPWMSVAQRRALGRALDQPGGCRPHQRRIRLRPAAAGTALGHRDAAALRSRSAAGPRRRGRVVIRRLRGCTRSRSSGGPPWA